MVSYRYVRRRQKVLLALLAEYLPKEAAAVDIVRRVA